MDLPWGDERTIQFITNVGLVTTSGPFGDNIMAAEWTHQVSYSPGLIVVCVGRNKATEANIHKSKEFGVSLAAVDQAGLSHIAGNSSGKTVDKVALLKELGFKFFPAKQIKVLLVKEAVLNVECRLVKEMVLGDHTMFVGEVLQTTLNASKEPLAYHKTRYWKLGEPLPKPSEKERENVQRLLEKHKK